jgi:Domain of unknown function (DUF5664)
MSCLDKIDWKLFHKQKMLLASLASLTSFSLKQVKLLDGVINMMDNIQDEYEPKNLMNARFNLLEIDPNGRSANEPGSKLDAGKNRLGLIFNGFSLALQEVGKVGTFGANKYTANGWQSVPNGVERYTDAMYRHLMKEAAGEAIDPDSGTMHAAQAAWNCLAVLELKLRELNEKRTN